MKNANLLKAMLLSAIFSSPVQAVETTSAVLDVTVIIQPPSCTINNGQAVEVNFGDQIPVADINGVNFQQTVPSALDCQGYITSTRLKVQGIGSAFDTDVLKTSFDQLGIAFRTQGGTALPLETWLDVNLPTQPVIYAVPVKDPAAELPAGPFTGTATLVVEVM
jgi:type 1 fimbria pilin